ncbi:MAG: hypothetical protein LKK21_11580 [Prevotella sp.]|jgi:preprotein translocase subunit SecD|nr:hypothetical protein [Prevotella sp.]MCI2088759.1 hypothetical protein [Prevotella sp.]MCI2126261.1 hypothetical protein [Prevotella sp.]
MKLADFLSDKSKQALNEIRKYYSEESIDKQDYAAESNDDKQSKEIAKPTRKVDRRIEWQEKKAELRQRLKEKKEAYILAKETERIKHALGKSKSLDTREYKKEENNKEQNRIRVENGNKIYPTSTTNSLKAWSIPMGGQNKRY